MEHPKKYNLDERLIDFAARMIDVSELLPNTKAGAHLGDQLVRSGTSPALHYGEAQAAESTADFIHKMKVCLKELRETFNCLRLIHKKGWISMGLEPEIKEANELISIFFSSIRTAQMKLEAKKTKRAGAQG
jgi:four helix bundle protein